MQPEIRESTFELAQFTSTMPKFLALGRRWFCCTAARLTCTLSNRSCLNLPPSGTSTRLTFAGMETPRG